MLEDTNSLDGALMILAIRVFKYLFHFILTMEFSTEPRQANLYLRAFRHDKF